MNTTLPLEPNSDGWISFHAKDKGPLTLSETCQFRLPEDAYEDDRLWDGAGINLFPKELEVALTYGDLNEQLDVWVRAQAPEIEAKKYEKLVRNSRFPNPASSVANDGTPRPPKTNEEMSVEEFRNLAKIWKEIADNAVSEESIALVKTRQNLAVAWNLLADQLLDDADTRAVERVRQDVQRLLKGMSEGREAVGDMYFDLITTLILQMNALRKSQAELVEKMVRWRVRWPSLTAAHPSYRLFDDPPESLGVGYPFRMDRGSRWQPGNDPCQVALHLAFFLHRLKRATENFAKEQKVPAARFAKNLQEVMALKPLPESSDDWWRAAAWHFCEAYPEPEKNPRFQKWLTAPSHKKSPKEMRRRILEKLQQAFVSILGGNKL